MKKWIATAPGLAVAPAPYSPPKGYRGKVEERARARELRAQSWTLLDIAGELGVAKSSVSALGPRRRVRTQAT